MSVLELFCAVDDFCQAFALEWPKHLLTYGRFVELMQRSVAPLAVYLRHCFGTCTGRSFVDSTALAVCRNQRIHQHKV